MSVLVMTLCQVMRSNNNGFGPYVEVYMRQAIIMYDHP